MSQLMSIDEDREMSEDNFAVANSASVIIADDLVPEQWRATNVLNPFVDLKDTLLAKIDIDRNQGQPVEKSVYRGFQILQSRVSKKRSISDTSRVYKNDMRGTIVVVFRRPGLQACREQALALVKLVAEHPQHFAGIQIIGVIKNMRANDSELLEFMTRYFAIKNAKVVESSSSQFYCNKSEECSFASENESVEQKSYSEGQEAIVDPIRNITFPIYLDKTLAFFQVFNTHNSKPFGSILAALVDMLTSCRNRLRATQSTKAKSRMGRLQSGIIGFEAQSGRPVWAVQGRIGHNISTGELLRMVQTIR